VTTRYASQLEVPQGCGAMNAELFNEHRNGGAGLVAINQLIDLGLAQPMLVLAHRSDIWWSVIDGVEIR
jgi:hypothetical protein